MKPLHLDHELDPFFEDAVDRPMAQALAAHVAHHCRSCGQRLAAAGFETTKAGPCWRMEDVPRLFELEEDEATEWQLLLHAATSCPGCRKNLAPLLAVLRTKELAPRPMPTLEELGLALTRHGAGKTTRSLLDLSTRKANQAVEELPAATAWGVAETLCRHTHTLASRAPARALEVACLAERAAAKAVLLGQPENLRAGLVALALAHRGNALRMLDELHAARGTFDEAFATLQAARPEVRDLFSAYYAEFLFLRASLWVDTRHFRLAFADLGLAKMEAKGASHLPPHFEANRLLKLAYVALCAGDPAQAWKASRDAALLISERQNPLLALMARHNEFVALIQMQQCPQALELLPRVKALARAVQEPQRWLSVLWAEARLAWLLGQPERAEELFAKVRRGFLELGSGLSAAVATVELAHVLFLTGKAVLVKPLAEEMVAVFADKELKSELIEALTLFMKAALTERLDAQLLARLVTYLHRAEYDPRLRFRARVG